MRGTIQKKGNRWYAVVYDGVNPKTGNYRRRWVPAGTRRADAERVLSELVQRRYAGDPVVTEKLTVGEYLTQRWLPIQRARLRASTYESYRSQIEGHVVPALGSRKLDRLTVEDVDLFYAHLLTQGGRTHDGQPRPLAPNTVRNIHAMFNKAMGDALRKGVIVRNVVALADAPAQRARKRDEIRAWEADQLATFLDAIRPHRLHPAFHLAAFTGMRRGEVLGLRWRDLDLDLDLEAGRLSVGQALVSVRGVTQISDVKTPSGRRTIDLDSRTVDVLAAWRIERAEELGGVNPGGGDLVFCRPDGAWILPGTFSQTFARKVRQLDVPRISLHDLRHTHATLLLKAGVPVKVVSERLGHSSVAFTMSVYQHVLPGMQAEAAALFAQLIGQVMGEAAPQ